MNIEATKCAVKDCENHSHQGKFVGLLCSPCHNFIAGDGGLYSQAYRNSRSMIDAAIVAERMAVEQKQLACAEVCREIAGDKWALYKGLLPYNGTEDGRADNYVQGLSDGADLCADAIELLGEK
jgi:hypothetical protein